MNHPRAIKFWYHDNHDGKEYITMIPTGIVRYGKSSEHPVDQWLIMGFDVDKQITRDFALVDMKEIVGAAPESNGVREGKS